jgi:hypothetical protein
MSSTHTSVAVHICKSEPWNSTIKKTLYKGLQKRGVNENNELRKIKLNHEKSSAISVEGGLEIF